MKAGPKRGERAEGEAIGGVRDRTARMSEAKSRGGGFVPETVSEASRRVPEDLPRRQRASDASEVGGEAGIRTLGTTLRSYNGLANRRFRPLSHLTADSQV